jgi:hypothetical protein
MSYVTVEDNFFTLIIEKDVTVIWVERMMTLVMLIRTRESDSGTGLLYSPSHYSDEPVRIESLIVSDCNRTPDETDLRSFRFEMLGACHVML